MENFIDGLSVYLHGSFILAYVAAYLGGVFISFTPCVYPMIPITIAFIGAHGSGSKVKGLVLSIVYVLGMSVTYSFTGRHCRLYRQIIRTDTDKSLDIFHRRQYMHPHGIIHA